jgi:hypothetical protein
MGERDVGEGDDSSSDAGEEMLEGEGDWAGLGCVAGGGVRGGELGEGRVASRRGSCGERAVLGGESCLVADELDEDDGRFTIDEDG